MRNYYVYGSTILVSTLVVVATASLMTSSTSTALSDPPPMIQSSNGPQHNDSMYYWEEEIPPEDEDEYYESTMQQKPPRAKRSLFWNKKQHQMEPDTGVLIKQDVQPQTDQEPHLMRTNEWEIRLSRIRRRKSSLRLNQTMILDFARNGYVRIQPTTNSKSSIGKWKLLPWGIAWEMPIELCESNANNETSTTARQQQHTTTLHFYADLHLNQFGERPRMVRGIITRDRYYSNNNNKTSWLKQHWFRPVICQFQAQGIGQDTADVTYSNRGFGLSSSSK